MKLYPNQIASLEYVIDRVTNEGRVLDLEIKAQVDQNKKWGAKDRRNFNQAAYDMIRNYEMFVFLAEKKGISTIAAYLNSLVDVAIDFENVKTEFPELEFDIFNSIPKEVLKLFREQNIQADENLIAMHRIGGIFLRINTSLSTVSNFENKLKEFEIDYKKIDSIVYNEKKISLSAIRLSESTQKHKELFKTFDSLFEIQDIGSQILTELIDFKNAKVIIEACAGNGGKTAHIMDKTRDTNPLIVCFDSEKKKLEHLQQRISKWIHHKVVTEPAKEKEIAKYENMADILFLDVPCTGSGTMKRQSDIKYRLSQEILNSKVELQREIFEKFHNTVQAGGRIVYTTCSLFRDENENQMEWMMKQGYACDYSKTFEPYLYDGDGFFIAVLTKK